MVCNPDEKLLRFDGEICEDYIQAELDDDYLDEEIWNEMSYRFFGNDYYDDLDNIGSENIWENSYSNIKFLNFLVND
jgi:hypothetical protein